MSVFDEPEIDCHCHLLDPVRFPNTADTPFLPAGQEIATLGQMNHVFRAYGVRRALLVQPNSGYGGDNRCLLDAIAQSEGRFKGIAVVPHNVSLDELTRLKSVGIVGVAFNVPFYSVSHYLGTEALLAKLSEIDMFLQIQVHEDQLPGFLPLIERSRVRLLIDHCGRPDIAAGLDGAAFQALLALGRQGRASIKLSGYIKFSRQAHPFPDTWPFLRAPARVDYGPLLTLTETLFPDAADRRTLFWTTASRFFGFGE